MIALGNNGVGNPIRSLVVVVMLAAMAGPAQSEFAYVGAIETSQALAIDGATAHGMVFDDRSRDGVRQPEEPGIEGVIVSNGNEVVLTDAEGRYALPVHSDMTLMVSKPAGWQTPVSADGVPQFFYHHKPAGTSTPLRYGGLPPTGQLPAEVNFPLVKVGEPNRFRCIAMGDTQTYSNQEIGWARDSVLASIIARNDLGGVPCMILLGDVVGDDLGLIPRVREMFSVLGAPQYYVHGNHDYDHDAQIDADSADSWRRLYGPSYYSFEIGSVFFVVLDNVVYPCTAADVAPDDRANCGNKESPVYNGRVTERQMRWLEATLAEVPRDRLIVLTHHIPLVSFADSRSGRHQTDNALELHKLLDGRPALSLSGHTHTFEYLAAGESFEGWKERVGVVRVPFDHVVGGAPAGNWYQGDLGFNGTPLAFASDGTPPGYMVLDFDGTEHRVTFHAANERPDRQMALSFNTPGFREWFETALAWQGAVGQGADAVPPVTVGDLDDLQILTPKDVEDGVWIVANVWSGDRNTRVTARIGDGPEMPMERTQAGDGEAKRSGAYFADPFAVMRQMTIGRYAWESTNGDRRAQGVKVHRGSSLGPVPPQGIGADNVARSSMHIWRLRLPENLPQGVHVATVTATDRHERPSVERIIFEVRDARPPRFFRSELWDKPIN
jgi:3',5'-cyclic AMP phosphodiesterase CpdA